MEELRLYTRYLALAVAILGTIKFKDISGTKAKYFLFSIWYIVLTEFIGENFYKWFDKINYIVYNVYIVIQFTFYLWWFRSLLKSLVRKKIVLGFIVIHIIFCAIDILFVQDVFREIITYSYALAVIFLVISICYYFIEVFNSEKVLKIRDSIYFWFSVGLLLFHATYLPFLLADKFFLFGDVVPLSLATFILNLIMVACFSMGFIKAKNSANEFIL